MVKEIVEQTPDLRKKIYNCLNGKCSEEMIGVSTRVVYRLKINEEQGIEYLALKIYPNNFPDQKEKITNELAFFNHIEKEGYPAPEFFAMVRAGDKYGEIVQDLKKDGKYEIKEFPLSDNEAKQVKNYTELLRKGMDYLYFGNLEEEFGDKINLALFIQIGGNHGELIFGDGDQLKVDPEIIKEFYRDYSNNAYLIDVGL